MHEKAALPERVRLFHSGERLKDYSPGTDDYS